MFKIFLVLVGLIAVLFISATIKRNKRLDKWAKSVPISEAQRIVMFDLWDAFKSNRIPEIDPLSKITKDDLEYIKRICSPDFRPEEFGSAKITWLASFQSLRKKGYSIFQAVIIAGMTINRVGRKDI